MRARVSVCVYVCTDHTTRWLNFFKALGEREHADKDINGSRPRKLKNNKEIEKKDGVDSSLAVELRRDFL